MGYLTYGSSVKNNIISSIPNGVKKDAAILLLSGHLFFAFLIVANGAILEIEHQLKVPNRKHFNCKQLKPINDQITITTIM